MEPFAHWTPLAIRTAQQAMPLGRFLFGTGFLALLAPERV
jgi:hypothetical protein